MLIIVAGFWLAILLIAGPAGFGSISAAHLVAMHVHLAAFAVLFGALSFGVGAATGQRALAQAGGAAARLLACAASGTAPQIEGLDQVVNLSAFTWLTSSDPLRSGIDLVDVGIMLGLATVFVALRTWGFRCRDLAG